MDKNKAALEALDRLLLKIERSILTHTEIEGYGEDVGRVRAYLTEPVIDDALSRWEMDVMDKTIKSWDVSAIENQKQPVIEDKKPSKYVTVYDKNGSRSQLRGYHTPDVVSRVPHEQEPVIPDAALREAVLFALAQEKTCLGMTLKFKGTKNCEGGDCGEDWLKEANHYKTLINHALKQEKVVEVTETELNILLTGCINGGTWLKKEYPNGLKIIDGEKVTK